MKAVDLERLIFNPFHNAKVLHHFLSGAVATKNHGIKFELIYLVLPLLNDHDVCNLFQSRNKNSTFRTIFSESAFQKIRPFLNEQSTSFKSITNSALIALSSTTNALEIMSFIRVTSSIEFNKEKNLYLKAIYKASFNCGRIFAKTDYLILFKQLGITQL